MPETQQLTAAFLIGIFGGLHCIGMCGGIMGALSMAVPPEHRVPQKLLPLLFGYNLGRILSYAIAGALMGFLAGLLASWFSTMGFILRSIAALMLVAMGLYLAGWWSMLRHIEKAGSALWQRLQPAIKTLMPVDNLFKAMLVGSLWGWLPCGLIYSTLTWSAMTSDWQSASLLMLVFGLGTLPAVIASGMILQKLQTLVQNRWTRSGAGIVIIIFGIWTFPGISQSIHGADHHQHAAPPQHKHENHGANHH